MYLYLFTSMAWKFICTVCSTEIMTDGMTGGMTENPIPVSPHFFKWDYDYYTDPHFQCKMFKECNLN